MRRRCRWRNLRQVPRSGMDPSAGRGAAPDQRHPPSAGDRGPSPHGDGFHTGRRQPARRFRAADPLDRWSTRRPRTAGRSPRECPGTRAPAAPV